MPSDKQQVRFVVDQETFDWLDAQFRKSKDRHLSETIRRVLEAGRRALEAAERPAAPPPD